MAEKKMDLIKRLLTGMFVFLLIVMLLFFTKAWCGGYFSSKETLTEYLNRFGGLGPIVLMVIQALQVVLPVLPGFLGCIVGAIMFGAAGGFWINYIGISAGSLIAYWLARKFGVNFVKKMVSAEKYETMAIKIGRHRSYTLVLFLAILLPLAPDDFLCYFSGLTSMSAKRFTWIILLAKPWCILFYSILFAKMV